MNDQTIAVTVRRDDAVCEIIEVPWDGLVEDLLGENEVALLDGEVLNRKQTIEDSGITPEHIVVIIHERCLNLRDLKKLGRFHVPYPKLCTANEEELICIESSNSISVVGSDGEKSVVANIPQGTQPLDLCVLSDCFFVLGVSTVLKYALTSWDIIAAYPLDQSAEQIAIIRCYSDDDVYTVSTFNNRDVQLTECSKGVQPKQITLALTISLLRINAWAGVNRKRVVMSYDSGVRLYSTEDGAHLFSVNLGDKFPISVASDPAGRVLVLHYQSITLFNGNSDDEVQHFPISLLASNFPCKLSTSNLILAVPQRYGVELFAN
eukprot:TRINITY_DN23232_c0_g1_i1.p1 TRINITY_DN23232_c0_g1~~TRINITY_DN23232_c0_g1_i1.p1  ORF type:complete len:321 (+),score=37.93 TRINITY_DN23232_c0_g1_i1:121-1083(+)